MLRKKNILIILSISIITHGCAYYQALDDCKMQAAAAIKPDYKTEMRRVREVIGTKVVGSKTTCTTEMVESYCSRSKKKKGQCPPPKEEQTCISKNIEEDIYGYVDREVTFDLNRAERERYQAQCMKNHPLLQR